ncbi:MAG: family channel protein [Methanomicrobia archaeon]|nr:family channel protein [Methanomicrobia archaeon]
MASFSTRCLAEGVGTALLIYFGAGAAAITLMLAHGTQPATSFNIGIGMLGGLADWLAIGMSFAIVLAAIIYSLGRVSGAHVNPAVTIALLSTKRFPAGDAAGYIVAQCIGAAVGSLLFFLTVGMNAVTVGALGATTPFPTIGYGQAILVEAIATFVLMLVIMGVAVDARAPPGFAGLIIGLTLGGMITATGNIAGASLNPARTFGPYVMDWLLGGPNLWVFLPIYLIGPVIGAVLAAFFYDWITKE